MISGPTPAASPIVMPTTGVAIDSLLRAPAAGARRAERGAARGQACLAVAEGARLGDDRERRRRVRDAERHARLDLAHEAETRRRRARSSTARAVSPPVAIRVAAEPRPRGATSRAERRARAAAALAGSQAVARRRRRRRSRPAASARPIRRRVAPGGRPARRAQQRRGLRARAGRGRAPRRASRGLSLGDATGSRRGSRSGAARPAPGGPRRARRRRRSPRAARRGGARGRPSRPRTPGASRRAAGLARARQVVLGLRVADDDVGADRRAPLQLALEMPLAARIARAGSPAPCRPARRSELPRGGRARPSARRARPPSARGARRPRAPVPPRVVRPVAGNAGATRTIGVGEAAAEGRGARRQLRADVAAQRRVDLLVDDAGRGGAERCSRRGAGAPNAPRPSPLAAGVGVDGEDLRARGRHPPSPKATTGRAAPRAAKATAAVGGAGQVVGDHGRRARAHLVLAAGTARPVGGSVRGARRGGPPRGERAGRGSR